MKPMKPLEKCVYLGKEMTVRVDGDPVTLKKGMICDVKLTEPEYDYTAYKMDVTVDGHTIRIFYQSLVDVYVNWLNVKKG